MSETRVLYDSFNIYYDKGMKALDNNHFETAVRNLYLAAETLLKLAKLSEGNLKSQRIKRAIEITQLADKIAKQINRKLTADSQTDTQANVTVVENEVVTLEEALKELNGLIGLESVKTQINDWVEQIKVFKMRQEQGLNVPPMSYHLIFTGNPGTGKTTVARIIAQIYRALGITRTANFVEAQRTDLVAGYIGQTAIKTAEVLKKSLGGVLFIDEAYTLVNKGANDFGQEAIDTLLKTMEDRRNDLVVIAAGYDDLMKGFIESNPGLKSRFKTIIHFDDYNADDLFKIFMTFCNKEQYLVEADTGRLLKGIIINLYNNRSLTFGNGREIRNLFEKIVTNQSRRVATILNPTKIDLMTIKVCDLPVLNTDIQQPRAVGKSDLSQKGKEVNQPEQSSPEDVVLSNLNNNYRFDWDSLPAITFDDVAGLEGVKEEVKLKVLLPLSNPEAFEGYRKKNGGGLLLYGPPGTGKTMIAAAIANEIGAKFCSVKPSDLLHQGAGNTEKAVRTLFAEARQFPISVIYFDEMDSIAQKDTKSSYSKQLRSELLAQLQGIESYGKDTGNILYLIASTNKPWDMDSAFIRPGRFGTRIYVGLPDEDARRYMIEQRLNNIKSLGVVLVYHDIDVDHIVDATNGFNGSDISNLLDKVEEFSIVRGISEGSKYITNDDFEKALEIIKSSVQKDDIEKLIEWNKNNHMN